MQFGKEFMTQSREALIRECYQEVFPAAAAFINRRGGSKDEAREVFQQSIVVYYEKLVTGDFKPYLNDHAYLMGIVKHQWMKYHSKSRQITQLDQIDVEDKKVPDLHKQKLLQYLKKSGSRCMELLQSFYYERLPMKQLADRFGFGSERSATVQKYKCLEKVRNEVRQKSLQYEDFFE